MCFVLIKYKILLIVFFYKSNNKLDLNQVEKIFKLRKLNLRNKNKKFLKKRKLEKNSKFFNDVCLQFSYEQNLDS